MPGDVKVEDGRVKIHGDIDRTKLNNGEAHFGHVDMQCGVDKTVLPEISYEAQASALHLQSEDTGVKTVEADYLQVQEKAWVGVAGAGVEASANLMDVKLSIVDATVGVGVDTKVGVKDDSIQAEVLGCGVTVGRKMGVSVFGMSIGVDLGRLFD